jgi:nitroimidazol reductase NimA-like FMN-containing flavoprotein (pyridoxamine 5'-phosphate oxidase superfamily)
MAKESGAPTERVRLRRMHERGHFDAATIHGILDAMPLAHVGYVHEGQPYVTPTLQWREGDRVYWHGSSASRALRAAKGAQVCLTVSIFDGFVMARSGMHHSINYRSVMILGEARKVTDPAEKEARLQTFVDGLFPGRWDMLRPVTAQEMKATTVLWMPIDEASAKIRTGPPGDDEEDYALPIWAGVLPVRMRTLPPVPDPRNLEGLTPPEHVTGFKFG